MDHPSTLRRFDMVSLDVFGTLLDLQHLWDTFWKTLDPSLPAESVRVYQAACDEIVFAQFKEMARTNHFRTTLSIFQYSLEEVFKRYKLAYKAEAAAMLFLRCLLNAPPYPDTIAFLRIAGSRYSLCLSCDGDNEMLDQARSLHSFTHVFTSQDLETYKQQGDGTFFQKAIQRLGMAPNRIMHIGDSPTEMVSAKKAGLVTCWLNRDAVKWQYEERPDHEIDSLLQALRLLEDAEDDKKG